MKILQDKYNANCLLAGDFNFYPNSGLYRLLSEGVLNLTFEDPGYTISG